MNFTGDSKVKLIRQQNKQMNQKTHLTNYPRIQWKITMKDNYIEQNTGNVKGTQNIQFKVLSEDRRAREETIIE